MTSPNETRIRHSSSLTSAKTTAKFTPDELLLQPWFLPNRVAFAIRAMAPPDYRLKMRYFFDDYGCMICERDDDYASNGMCHRCYVQVRKKIARSVKAHRKSSKDRRFDLGLIRQAKLAKKLLKKYSSGEPPPSPKSYQVHPTNPVDEALGPHSNRV
jgi:hypothetical protein